MLLSIIEKAVMHIGNKQFIILVLDENGLTNFSDAFKMSVDDLIKQLSNYDYLQKENEKLSSIVNFQESEIMTLQNVETDNRKKFIEEFEKELDIHRDNLAIIYESLDGYEGLKSSDTLDSLYNSSDNMTNRILSDENLNLGSELGSARDSCLTVLRDE
jgi:hypothetical protein